MDRLTRCVNALTMILIGLLAAGASLAQEQQKDQAAKPQAVSAERLTIEVTGGDANVPIENASVYVKTVHEHLLKDKKFEVNVKTNQKGVAHVPDAPQGRVLIQVVADGWKSYGHWYDVSDFKEPIKIHLERPPKWY